MRGAYISSPVEVTSAITVVPGSMEIDTGVDAEVDAEIFEPMVQSGLLIQSPFRWGVFGTRR